MGLFFGPLSISWPNFLNGWKNWGGPDLVSVLSSVLGWILQARGEAPKMMRQHRCHSGSFKSWQQRHVMCDGTQQPSGSPLSAQQNRIRFSRKPGLLSWHKSLEKAWKRKHFWPSSTRTRSYSDFSNMSLCVGLLYITLNRSWKLIELSSVFSFFDANLCSNGIWRGGREFPNLSDASPQNSPKLFW